MKLVSLLTVFALLFGNIAAAGAQASRSITIIAPSAAGGPTDMIARFLAERMRAPLGQSVVVENVTGAAGNIASGRVARAAPDGHTIIMGQTSTHVFNGAIYSLPFDVVKDFEPVALVATTSQLIVSRKGVPAMDLRDLISWLRANSEKATMATIGPGSPAHIGGILLQRITGTTFQFIPYRGGAPGMTDLLAGRIDIMMPQASLALPHVRAGTIKAYAVTAPSRLDSAPEIPTVDEAGAAGLHVLIWQALWAPKGTPRDIVGRLNSAVVEALADQNVRRRLIEVGHEIPLPSQQTPEALRAFQQAEIERWWPVIKAANIRIN